MSDEESAAAIILTLSAVGIGIWAIPKILARQAQIARTAEGKGLNWFGEKQTSADPNGPRILGGTY